MAETPGDRLYMIRLACGDGLRRAEPLPQFAKRVKKATGREYHQATLSLLERMKQAWKLSDVETFAVVDPSHRGRVWLAGWEDQQPGKSAIGPALPEPVVTLPPRAAARSRRGG